MPGLCFGKIALIMAYKTGRDLTKYQGHYSENNFWSKLSKVAKSAGVKVVYAALLLFYVLKSKDTSGEDRAKIVGALGYFILPLDLIPDWLPALGFTDDLAALTWALYAVAKNLTPDVKANAKAKLSEWFGELDDKALDGIG